MESSDTRVVSQQNAGLPLNNLYCLYLSRVSVADRCALRLVDQSCGGWHSVQPMIVILQSRLNDID